MRHVAWLLGLLLVLTGCAQGASQHVSGRLIAARPSDPFQATLAGARDVGPAPRTMRVSFLLALRDDSQARQAADLAAMYNPHSPHFGKFASIRGWRASYGPTPARVTGVRSELGRHGLTSQWQQGSDWLQVSGPAVAVDAAFHVRVRRYVSSTGVHFYASRQDPAVPSWLRPEVRGAGHISSYAMRKEQIAPVDGLTPADLLGVYDMKPLRQRGLNGAGMTVAFIEIDGFDQSDFDAFTNRFNLPPMHPVIKGGPRLSNVDGEAELDMEVVHEIAPAAKLTVYNCQDPCTDTRIVQREHQAVTDTRGGIISISLGGCEPAEGRTDATAEKGEFDRADGLGESVFVSSGDSGAFTCLTEDWGSPPGDNDVGASAPASSPGVTAVGGTRLSVTPNRGWYREEVWENPAETSGSGGGVSSFFARPAWQNAPGVVSSYNSNNARGIPDISAVADPLTSAQIVVKGHVIQEGGTSQAAPIWAGMTALIDQYLKRKGLHVVGFMNPALYTLARKQPGVFHDVTTGSNMVYPATRGYDLATGLGTPDAWKLATALEAYQRGSVR